MGDFVPVLSRWVHVISAVFLLGSALFAKLILRGEWTDAMAAAFRPWALRAVAGLLAAGVYNLLQKGEVPKPYHMVFGIKVLLGLHAIAVSLLLGKAGVDKAKRSRWLTGILASGLAVTLLSAYLRRIS